MLNQNIQSFFEEKLKYSEQEENKYKKKLRDTAILRIIVFVAGGGICVYFANERSTIPLVILGVITMGIFLGLVKKYNQLNYQLNYFKWLKQINQEEVLRSNRSLAEIKEGGEEYIDDQHPYSSDLDIFGKNSLFKFLNRTSTAKGKETLAVWLKKPADTDTVQKRQEAVIELKDKIDWIQDFQVKGRFKNFANTFNIETFLEWLNYPLHSSISRNLIPLMLLFSSIFIGSVIALILGWVSLWGPILSLAINLVYIGQRNKELQQVLLVTAKSTDFLKAYSKMIICVENLETQSPLLTGLKEKFLANGKKASKEISKLSSVLSQLEVRNNMLFFALVNNPFVFENLPLRSLTVWREKHSEDIRGWLAALAEIEALVSLAAFTHANPGFTFPKLNDSKFYFESKGLGHPLLNPKKRVDNDFSLIGKGKIALVTGSNMAGKTTFERTLGVNVVMALAGAPVCANELEISYMEVFSSMRIKDSLEENVSSFYAELKRFKFLLELLASERETLFLLDELLRGTNSADRQDGIRAIMKQLIASKGFGLISTHDLQLAEMADEFPQSIKNYSFNSRIENNKLEFNYLLEEGKCHSFSASKLMEMMGIKISESSD